MVGPTAVGKSALAVDLAKRLDGEIVNIDSRQLYRGLEIGTAVPSLEERDGVPHHGFAVVDVDERVSVGRFLQMARGWLQGIRERGRLPILVGGTGLYLRGLKDGISPMPVAPDRMRAWLRGRLGAVEARRWMALLDPERRAQIDPADRHRAIRALEVALLSGRPMSSLLGRREGALDVSWRIIACQRSRAELHARIRRRVGEMLQQGLEGELQAALAAGYDLDSPGLSAIGYRETYALLQGDLDVDGCREAIAAATRRYAKRQLTWFRREPEAAWFDLGEAGVADRAESWILAARGEA